ncbi:unnamed protein product, partial [Callosobruchus maculatus]
DRRKQEEISNRPIINIKVAPVLSQCQLANYLKVKIVQTLTYIKGVYA